jgi:hypothetical protein
METGWSKTPANGSELNKNPRYKAEVPSAYSQGTIPLIDERLAKLHVFVSYRYVSSIIDQHIIALCCLINSVLDLEAIAGDAEYALWASM